jgi:hypothetical protein
MNSVWTREQLDEHIATLKMLLPETEGPQAMNVIRRGWSFRT